MELRNESVEFESEKYGKCSCVLFEIPVIISNVDGIQVSATGVKPSTVDVKNKKLRILVAEDDAINQLYLTGFLKSHGWHVDTASNGLIALDKFKKNEYDIILMDGQMPKMDGFETTQMIREMVATNAGSNHIPIIAISGYAIAGERERFINAGMDDYISKPVDEGKLLSLIITLTSNCNRI